MTPEEAQEINQLCKHAINPITETLIGFCAAGSTFALLHTGLAAYDSYRFDQEIALAEEQLDTTEQEEIEIDGHVFGLPDDDGHLKDYLNNHASQTRSDKLGHTLGYAGMTIVSGAMLGTLFHIRKRELDPDFNLLED